MARKRRRFTAEFKARVALEALRERDSVQAIAARHELHPNQVTTWKRQLVGPPHFCKHHGSTVATRRVLGAGVRFSMDGRGRFLDPRARPPVGRLHRCIFVG